MRIYTFGLLTFPSVSSSGCGTDGLLLRQSFGTLLRRYDAVVHVQTITWNKQHNEQQKSTQGLQSSHILKNDNCTGIKFPPPLQPEHTEQQKPQAISLYRHRESLKIQEISHEILRFPQQIPSSTNYLHTEVVLKPTNPSRHKMAAKPIEKKSTRMNQKKKNQKK